MNVPLPRFVQIEPVGQCNLACRMCPVVMRGDGGPGKPPAFMPLETFRSLVDQFDGVEELHLQGLGEPFLHPRFFDMIAYAAARGLEVSTNTNLTALSERRAEQCVKSGLARLHVSLDAADAAAYEYIRVGSRYDRVVRNLKMLVDAKQRLGSPTPEIRLVAVLMRRNLDQLPGLVRFAHEHGIAALSVQHLAHDFTEDTLPAKYASMREFVDDQTLATEDPALVETVFTATRELAVALGVDLRLPRIQGGKKRGCDWPWRGAYVAYSGEAMPCCMVATPDRVNFGNMAREGVAPVWDNAAYSAFRDKLASDSPPDICRGCAVYRGLF
jgi:MoaA/NifB/PqqE/SkfB family radical SAM enzyme